MKTILKTNTTVKDGFVYNELEGKGLFGLSGNLTIQPEYQRNYFYALDGVGILPMTKGRGFTAMFDNSILTNVR